MDLQMVLQQAWMSLVYAPLFTDASNCTEEEEGKERGKYLTISYHLKSWMLVVMTFFEHQVPGRDTRILCAFWLLYFFFYL